MQTLTLPGAGLLTTRLGFGASALHHLLQPAARQRLLQCAFEQGFTHFDTARMYGEGMAERALGEFQQRVGRQHVTLASKFGIPAQPVFERLPALLYAQRALGSVGRRIGWAGSGERGRAYTVAAAEASLGQSLRALRTDYLDILFVHDPRLSDLPAVAALAEWLLRQKASGRVRYLGLAGQASVCVAIRQAAPEVFDILQVEDSLAGREADVVIQAGWPLQVTYGYLRLAGATGAEPLGTLQAALGRNPAGMVLVSTRKVERVAMLAELGK